MKVPFTFTDTESATFYTSINKSTTLLTIVPTLEDTLISTYTLSFSDKLGTLFESLLTSILSISILYISISFYRSVSFSDEKTLSLFESQTILAPLIISITQSGTSTIVQ